METVNSQGEIKVIGAGRTVTVACIREREREKESVREGVCTDGVTESKI